MRKKGTLEGYKQELLGKKFARLTVLDIRPYYRSNGKTNGYSAVCRCDCGNTKSVAIACLLKGTTTSCGCLQKEKARNNIKQALKWNEEHPEEMKQIRDKGIQSMLEWQKSHPEEASKQKHEAVNKALQWREEHPEEVKQFLDKAHQWQKEHPEEFVESLSKNITKAHEWNGSHPEEMKLIRERANEKAKLWKVENPELTRNYQLENIAKAQEWNRLHKEESLMRQQQNRREDLLNKISKEEKEVYDYLLSLGYPVERQFLLDNHYFDFRVNNFLIEYNGSVYHCSDYCNLENDDARLSMQNFKSQGYNSLLRDVAIKNGYHLIQLWDYQWIHDKEFLKELIKDQLSGTADYKEYIEDELLNNDYGFVIEGEQIEPVGKWISTSNPKSVVSEEYTKGRVLVYNSGSTKILL